MKTQMTNIFNDLESEITELFKAYRMAHFSLYNMKNTFDNFKDINPEIENFVLEDIDFDNYVRFDETEINKNSEDGLYQGSLLEILSQCSITFGKTNIDSQSQKKLKVKRTKLKAIFLRN